MAGYVLLANSNICEILTNASPDCGNFVMTRHTDSYSDCITGSPNDRPDALIVQAVFPMCQAQDLMLDLEAKKYCPAILMFTILPNGCINYTISDETQLPLSAHLAVFFEKTLNKTFECKRIYYRSTVWEAVYAETVNIQSDRQNALKELLLGCTPTEIQFYRKHFNMDFRDNGYYLFFWELNYSAYIGHSIYKDVYNLIGQTMKQQCEEILAQYNGGEFFYLKLTQVCIIIDDLCINSEKQKRTQLNSMVKQLISAVGSRKSICYLSNRTNNVSDFRPLYDRYVSERNVSFFIKEKHVIRSETLPKIITEANADEINGILNKISRYISYDITNSELDNTLRHLFFDVLKCSMNMPIYYYCTSVLGSALAKIDDSIEQDTIAWWLDSDRLRHSSIEEEYDVFSHIIQVIRLKRGNVKQTKSTLLIKAIDLIKTNYHEDITIEDIAEELYVSATYLSRIFKSALNVSVIQYLISCRIDHAKFLLEEKDYAIYTIAEQSGFSDVRHFSKTFKKQTGLTPSEFRKQLLD